jgi:hypothetical protein
MDIRNSGSVFYSCTPFDASWSIMNNEVKIEIMRQPLTSKVVIKKDTAYWLTKIGDHYSYNKYYSKNHKYGQFFSKSDPVIGKWIAKNAKKTLKLINNKNTSFNYIDISPGDNFSDMKLITKDNKINKAAFIARKINDTITVSKRPFSLIYKLNERQTKLTLKSNGKKVIFIRPKEDH